MGVSGCVGAGDKSDDATDATDVVVSDETDDVLTDVTDADTDDTDADTDDTDGDVTDDTDIIDETDIEGTDTDVDPPEDADLDGSPAGEDCDDGDPAVKPGATEIAGDGVDQDCDGQEMCFVDLDSDGFGRDDAEPSSDLTCDQLGRASRPGDCDDGDEDVFPGADEGPADGLDADCDGFERCFVDGDGDGVGTDALVVADAACTDVGAASGSGDCDDADPNVSPDAAEETGDGVDGDCDGLESCLVDGDGDGFGGVEVAETSALDCVAVGFAGVGGDCDDADRDRSPGANEIAVDGVDGDCDGQELCFVDADLDGAGSATTALVADLACATFGAASTSDDCDDGDDARLPGADEAPGDGIDSDCDGAERCFADGDGDGQGSSSLVSGSLACDQAGEAAFEGDCDDADPLRSATAVETVADGIDSDCDGLELCWEDADEDGYGGQDAAAFGGLDCDAEGLSTVAGDCRDDAPGVNPGAAEIAGNDADDDCDGALACYLDEDGDGFGGASTLPAADPGNGCVAELGEAMSGDDCDDGDASISPGATELLNDLDDDCDPVTTEAGLALWTSADGAEVRDVADALRAGELVLDAPGTLRLGPGTYDATLLASADLTVVGAADGTTVWSAGPSGLVLSGELPGLNVDISRLTVSGAAGGMEVDAGSLSFTDASLVSFTEGIALADTQLGLTRVSLTDNTTEDGLFRLLRGGLQATSVDARDNTAVSGPALFFLDSLPAAAVFDGPVTEAGDNTFLLVDNASGTAAIELVSTEASITNLRAERLTGGAGALVHATTSTVTLSDVLAIGFESTGDGGVLWIQDGDLTATRFRALIGSAQGSGGVLWSGDSVVTFNGGSLTNVYAEHGGVIDMVDSQVSLSGTYLSDASAYDEDLEVSGDGGAIRQIRGLLTATDLSIFFCGAARGAAIRSEDGSFTIANSFLSANNAASSGGAISWQVTGASDLTGQVTGTELNANLGVDPVIRVDASGTSGATLTLIGATVNQNEGTGALFAASAQDTSQIVVDVTGSTFGAHTLPVFGLDSSGNASLSVSTSTFEAGAQIAFGLGGSFSPVGVPSFLCSVTACVVNP